MNGLSWEPHVVSRPLLFHPERLHELLTKNEGRYDHNDNDVFLMKTRYDGHIIDVFWEGSYERIKLLQAVP